MPFRFEHAETPVEGAKRIAAERLDKAIATARMQQPASEDIHEIRKDLKSLRALLQVMRGLMVRSVRDQENQVFRDAARILSRRRDAEALLEALSRLYGSPSKPKGEAARPVGRRVVERIRQELEADANGSLSRDELNGVAALLSEVRGRIDNWAFIKGLNGSLRGSVFVETGLQHTYRRGRQRLKIIETIGIENATDDLWHEIRKWAKALGYQLRLLRKIWPPAIRVWAEALDELTEILGEDHDLALLRQRIVQLPFESSDTEEAVDARQRLLRVIERRRRRLKTGGLRGALMIYVEKPARFVDRLGSYWELWKNGDHAS